MCIRDRGYTFEKLLRNPRQAQLLKYIDVLVDGKFKKELRLSLIHIYFLVAQGGTSVLTEVPEMFGAETILMNRCRTKELFEEMCIRDSYILGNIVNGNDDRYFHNAE